MTHASGFEAVIDAVKLSTVPG